MHTTCRVGNPADPGRPAAASRAGGVWLGGVLTLLAFLAGPFPAAANALDLSGDWYLLVLYTDEDHPGQRFWEDAVWRFEKSGSRLRWTEYPLAIFGDDQGRFDDVGGRLARTEHWEPSDAQRAEIVSGLSTRNENARVKSLKRAASGGYRSVGGMRAQSASTIGYVELWTVEGLDAHPVFTRDATIGSGRTEDLEGRTRFATTEIREDGAVLVGRYARDASRRGTFRLYRAGPTRIAE